MGYSPWGHKETQPREHSSRAVCVMSLVLFKPKISVNIKFRCIYQAVILVSKEIVKKRRDQILVENTVEYGTGCWWHEGQSRVFSWEGQLKIAPWAVLPELAGHMPWRGVGAVPVNRADPQMTLAYS